MNVGEFLAQLATEHDTIAKVVAVIWYGGAAVVVFLVVTRRGWWKPTGPEIDWTTTANCPKCNEYGPYPWWERDALLSSPERARDVHQAWHELTQAVFGLVERCIHRATQGRKRRRSRPRASIEVSANDDGTLSASPVRDIPRPPLPYAQRPWRCALGRHQRVIVWAEEPGDTGPYRRLRYASRCRSCGVLLR